MKSWKRGIAAVAAVTLCLTSLPLSDVQKVSAAEVDSIVKLKPSEASPFHDTNGDGLGEFEGWGTSLCWWANRIGYSDALTQKAGELFFGDNGLDMNIGRYNVGGGDRVGEAEIAEVPVNEKAQFYDLETEGRIPEYQGTKMQVEECTDMSTITFEYSDADFGFTKGMPVGNFKKIGWINKIGDLPGDGDNLQYVVQAPEAGNYTVKLLLTLTGSNKRDVVLGVGEEEYVVTTDVINSNMIASGNNNMLFVVTIPNVILQAGENTVVIAGKTDWTLDFVKMAVIKSGEEGILTETQDEFLHAPHIVRSDSGVPGYATDVTKIDTSQHELSWYESNFARADAECGYAWNYNWDADKNQINVLKAAAAASGQDFMAEAFSNSPPYFMTVSGCSSGNTNSRKDNLRADSVNAFASYMADVIEHWQNNGITFQSATPMNEPYTNYWGANSNKQEGCHFDQGESQSRIIVALNNALKAKGIDLILSATDETSIDTQITSYNALSEEAKSVVSRIDTHTYSGSDREGLKNTALEAGKNLWMSEVDGTYTGGTNAGEMSAALGLAQRMMTDVNGLDSTAWILWNAIDMHSDSSEYGQSWVNKGSANDYLSMDALEAAWKSRSSQGYWGLAAADHDNQDIVLSMKYYGYGQFSRYIRPGYTIIGSSKGTTLAAYDPNGQKAVIVAMNTSENDKNWKFDLSGFETMGNKITAIRTSGTMAEGEKWADVTANDNIVADTENRYFTATMKGNSITTYIVEGVSGIEDKPQIKQISVAAEQVSGEKVWNNGTVNTPAKVVDNNYDTFFDGVDTDNGEAGYIVINLGEAKEIAALGYAPRNGFAGRCVGGTFYGSIDGNNWTTIYTIEEAPKKNTDTIIYFNDFLTGKAEAFQYIKYVRENECNVSELKVYEPAPTITSVDISKLQEKVQEAEKLTPTDYTTGSYSKVEESLLKGKKLLTNPTTQEEVNNAITEIQSALDRLVNIAELKTYYQSNKDKTEEGYTKETYQIYQDALTEAKEALENPDLSQADADTAYKNLKAAVEGLKEETKNPVSKDQLKNLYETYVKLEAEGYTEESFAGLTKALSEAKQVLENENVSQKEVDEAYSNLQAAKEALEIKQTEEPQKQADKNNLSKLYQECMFILKGNYTTESYDAFVTARDTAKSVLDDPKATQEEATAAYKNLEAAVRGLTVKENTQSQENGGGTVSGTGNNETKPNQTNSNGTTTGSKGANTGDETPVTAALATTVIALWAVVIVWKKKERMNQ